LAQDANIPSEWRDAISAWALANQSVAAVYVFGSRARGDNKADSDLDLAILVDAPDGAHLSEFIEHRAEWQRELNARVKNVVVNLGLANQEEAGLVAPPAVTRDGILIFERD